MMCVSKDSVTIELTVDEIRFMFDIFCDMSMQYEDDLQNKDSHKYIKLKQLTAKFEGCHELIKAKREESKKEEKAHIETVKKLEEACKWNRNNLPSKEGRYLCSLSGELGTYVTDLYYNYSKWYKDINEFEEVADVVYAWKELDKPCNE